ncbi:hypothetical protein ACUXG4_003164 [Cupriavidus metallidurans]
MRDIIDGFLRFQREVVPQRVELFKQLATTQNPKGAVRHLLGWPRRARTPHTA